MTSSNQTLGDQQVRDPQLQDQKVTIIGAGIVGLCCALELQEKGRSVVLIDRLPPAEATSYGNAGMLCSWSVVPEATPGIWKEAPAWLLNPAGPLFVRPAYILKMIPWLRRFLSASNIKSTELQATADAMLSVNQPTVDLYRQHLAGTGYENLVVESDFLHIYRQPENMDPDGVGVTLRRERGADIEFMNEAELRAAVPALSHEYKAAMRLGGQGYTINPGKLGRVLAEKVLRQQGEIIQQEVLACTRSSDSTGYRLTLSDRVMNVDQLVIAAGAWSHRIASELGNKIPLEAERGYHVMFPNAGVDVPMPLMDAQAHVAITPMEMGLRIAGTAEFAGVDAEPNYRRAAVLERLAISAFPDLNPSNPEYWMGPRPSLPDTVPVISPLEGHDNAWIACGHGHLGLTGAPMTARLIASMVQGDRIDVDPQPYRINRF